MKKFITYLSVLFAVVAFASCSCPEKKQMQEAVLTYLKAPSTYKCIKFEKNTETVMLKDEVRDRIESFENAVQSSKRVMENSKSFLDERKKEIDEYEKMGLQGLIDASKKTYEYWEERYNEDAKTFEKNNDILNYLNSIDTTSTDVTFYHCKLTYEAQNAMGVPLQAVCEGRFNKEGELVAIKYQEEDDWDLIGNWFSIPNYYEMIK